jgi:hypothetical protein
MPKLQIYSYNKTYMKLQDWKPQISNGKFANYGMVD